MRNKAIEINFILIYLNIPVRRRVRMPSALGVAEGDGKGTRYLEA
jgi:hypothetical protein